MRANRLLHAITVSNMKSIWWTQVYSNVVHSQAGRPFNILLTYWYIRKAGKTQSERVKIVQKYRELIGKESKLYIDSGVFSLKVQLGFKMFDDIDNVAERANAAKKRGMEQLDELVAYVSEYARFLHESSHLWDYAFNFDSDFFLPTEQTDDLNILLLNLSKIPKKKLIYVYHTCREFDGDWWEHLCDNIDYTYLAIGTGVTQDPPHYTKLIKRAHSRGKYVHTLGIASRNFLRDVPVDTGDSTTHLIGGKFALLMLPHGKVSFSKVPNTEDHYLNIDASQREVVDDYIKKMGMTVPDIIESPYKRNIMNIWTMNKYWDIPFVETSEQLDLFSDV